jgi:hypothetical protein
VFLNAPVACLSSKIPALERASAQKGLFGETYSREFTVDILDQEGAEFSKDLEDCWL